MTTKLIRVFTENTESVIRVDDLMSFIMTATRGPQLSIESTERLRQVFSDNLGKDKQEITLHEFRKIVPCKDEFFVNRIFNIFDSDQSGYITLVKFIETVGQFSSSDDDSKIEFLFKQKWTELSKIHTLSKFMFNRRATILITLSEGPNPDGIAFYP